MTSKSDQTIRVWWYLSVEKLEQQIEFAKGFGLLAADPRLTNSLSHSLTARLLLLRWVVG